MNIGAWARTVAVLAATTALGVAAASGAVTARPVVPPTVRLRALAGHGELAIVRGGILYLAGGAARGVLAVAGPGSASYPEWSHDAAWVAYSRTGGPPNALTQLWVVRANGEDSHRVAIGRPGALYVGATAAGPVWSPTADLLATSASTADGAAAGLWVASPDGRPFPVRTLAGRLVQSTVAVDIAPRGYGPVWAPSGDAVAYAETLPYRNPVGRSDALYTRPLAGRPARHLVAKGAGIIVASWWPHGSGLLYWTDPQHSASLAADGLALRTIDLADNRTQYLATTLAYRGWISWGPRDTVALVAGGPRLAWTGKVVMECLARIPAEATQACVTISRPGGPITEDPAWSNGGLAYVTARDLGSQVWGMSAARVAAWQATKELWLAPPGKAAKPATFAGSAIVDPVWSAAGNLLMVVRGGDVCLLDPARRTSAEVATGVTPDLYPLGYYGYLDESQVLAWSAAAA